MRSREIIQYLIYPKMFLSLAIPYKGQYFLRIRVYQKKIMNGKIVQAFPKHHQQNTFKHSKNNTPSNVSITQKDVFFQTQSFFLHYSNVKVSLNSYCFFTLQYDESRQFKTFIEIQLIRKPDPNVVPQGCISISKDQLQQDSICKEIYVVNNFKRLDMFERVYFQHYDFYCALDLYMASVSLGKVMRNNKFQLCEFYINQSQFKKSQSFNGKISLSLNDLISEINNQVEEYSELKKVAVKYQQLIKAKKSFLFQATQNFFVQNFQDLSHLKYSCKDYEKRIPQQAFVELLDVSLNKIKDKKLVNQNIKYLFSKLPGLIRDISISSFKNLITQSIIKKLQLKKKYLLKKVPQNVLFNQSSYHIRPLSPRHSFQNTSQFISEQVLRTAFTFKQNRKIQKKQFISVRRQQFIKSSHVISLKECNFPMLLIQKSSTNICLETKQQVEIQNISNIDMSSSCNAGVNLIVLIHGYQGSHHDLKKIKNYLQHFSPNMKVLSITSIEKSITEGIQFLAQKISDQIQFYISNSYESINKINFIGFSLGGVLARACLKHLQKYKNIMNLLITLASPHLGVSESQNTWVNLGLWYLSRVDKVQNIKQLNFQSVTEKDSFLMKLSKQEEIGWFKKVVIISCSQDQFVPHYSARIIGETKNEQINIMAFNIMSRIKSYDRIQVWFDIQKKTSIDKIIGRKPHIEFIENYSFLQMLCKIYQNQL